MTKTQLTILWGLGVLIVVVLGTLGWVFSQAGQPQALSPTAAPALPSSTEMPPSAETTAPPVYRLPETSHSAQNHYEQAERAAQEWQPDAALVSAAASWSFVGLDDFSKPIDWTFQFYSSTTGRAYTINVDQTGLTPIHETLSPYALPVIDVEQWQVDSHQAINAWLNRGGGAFLKRHPVVDVSIRLARPQGDNPAWTIVGIDDSGQAAQTERIDARGPMVR